MADTRDFLAEMAEKRAEEQMLEEGLDQWRDTKLPMFYPCPDYSPAQYGEKLTSDEVEREEEEMGGK